MSTAGQAKGKLAILVGGGPAPGINSVIGAFPILGPILAGPRGEGVIGMTFAITGPMSNPQMIVNPLSGFLPGILREMMPMTNPSKVSPR